MRSNVLAWVSKSSFGLGIVWMILFHNIGIGFDLIFITMIIFGAMFWDGRFGTVTKAERKVKVELRKELAASSEYDHDLKADVIKTKTALKKVEEAFGK